ncbi:hypothetical protein NUM3379_10700 [Kineococcus sp. NUM-3379]
MEVRRSRRRSRTVSAYRDGGRTVVLIPARFTVSEEQLWVGRMLDRLAAADRRRRPVDEELAARASELSRRYLDGRARPRSVAWVDNQQTRWGSCTPGDGTIRLSSRLQGMPGWVLDYVILHELAHLLVPAHGPAFWALLEGYPRTERARGFLLGIDFRTGEGGRGAPGEGGEQGADAEGGLADDVTDGEDDEVTNGGDDEVTGGQVPGQVTAEVADGGPLTGHDLDAAPTRAGAAPPRLRYR